MQNSISEYSMDLDKCFGEPDSSAEMELPELVPVTQVMNGKEYTTFWPPEIAKQMRESLVDVEEEHERIASMSDEKFEEYLSKRIAELENHVERGRNLSRSFSRWCQSIENSTYSGEIEEFRYESPIVSIADSGVFRWSLACYRSKRRRREDSLVHVSNCPFSSPLEVA